MDGRYVRWRSHVSVERHDMSTKKGSGRGRRWTTCKSAPPISCPYRLCSLRLRHLSTLQAPFLAS